jgi:hypothetical protein
VCQVAEKKKKEWDYGGNQFFISFYIELNITD